MLARPTLARPVRDDASTPKTQARPTEERFLLRVDGQIKRSFSSKEDAAIAGAVCSTPPRSSKPSFHSPTSPARARISLQIAHEFMVAEGAKSPSDIVLRR
jgi:hypothetical protein